MKNKIGSFPNKTINSSSMALVSVCLLLALAVTACAPADEAPQVSTAFPAPLPTETSAPNIIVQTPTLTTEILLPTPGLAFCENDQVQAAMDGLVDAIKGRDGAALLSLVDPVEGLDIYYTFANPPVNIPVESVEGLFDSTFVYSLGDHPGSGLPVEGTFKDEILPSLLDVMDKSFSPACQTLERGIGTGPTTATIGWPEKFEGMPFIALYRAPGPQDNELDWRTWAVGFTVVNGEPKIRVLVQYFWEI